MNIKEIRKGGGKGRKKIRLPWAPIRGGLGGGRELRVSYFFRKGMEKKKLKEGNMVNKLPHSETKVESVNRGLTEQRKKEKDGKYVFSRWGTQGTTKERDTGFRCGRALRFGVGET